MKALKLRQIKQINLGPEKLHTIVNLYGHSLVYDWIEPELEDAGVDVISFRMENEYKLLKYLYALIAAFKAVLAAKKNKAVLFSHNIEAANTVGFLMYLPGLRVPHPIYPARKRQKLTLSWIKNNIDAFVVHSKIEEDSLPSSFNIPAEKVYTAYWAYENHPDVSDDPAMIPGDYICAIGNSDRDYKTVFEAMRRNPDKKLVVVGRPHNVAGLDIPSNVEVHTMVPLAHCWNLIKYCKVFILPLNKNDSVTGHSVLVQAMRERKPCVVTNAASMNYYAENNVTAKMVEVGDIEGTVKQINLLWNDGDLAQRIADQGYQFAETHFSQSAVAQSLLAAMGSTD